METLADRLRELRLYMRAEGVDTISRRYFVMNAFDGAMTILSIVVGLHVAGDVDPRMVLSVGLASCVAMGISGVAGAFMTERAERLRRLKELEDSMLTSLRNSVYNYAFQLASVYVALIDGLAPIFAASIPLSPFILAVLGVHLPVGEAYLSIALNLAMLFSLGVFLGKVSKESLVASGFKMLAVGCITLLLCAVTGLL